jgi:hypothetical protein
VPESWLTLKVEHPELNGDRPMVELVSDKPM